MGGKDRCPKPGQFRTGAYHAAVSCAIMLWKLSYPEHCLLCCVNDVKLSGSYRPKSSWGTDNPGVRTRVKQTAMQVQHP